MFDLHLHSDASDGEASLATVIAALAVKRDLVRVALTDHDTVVSSIALAAVEPRAWVGAELTSYVGACRIDMLALGVRPDDTTMSGYLAVRAGERRARFALFGELLRGQGWIFEPSDAVLARAQLAQPHVVAELRRHPENLARLATMGIAGSAAEGTDDPVYAKVLAPLAPVIRARTEVAVAESPMMVGLIHAAGGLAVVAHPWLSAYESGRVSLALGRKRLDPIITAGVDALEVWHPSQDASVQAEIAQVAASHGLLVTAGSDDHSADLRYLGTASPRGAAAAAALGRLELAWERRQAKRR